jgi:hypothetical protein
MEESEDEHGEIQVNRMDDNRLAKKKKKKNTSFTQSQK